MKVSRRVESLTTSRQRPEMSKVSAVKEELACHHCETDDAIRLDSSHCTPTSPLVTGAPTDTTAQGKHCGQCEARMQRSREHAHLGSTALGDAVAMMFFAECVLQIRYDTA